MTQALPTLRHSYSNVKLGQNRPNPKRPAWQTQPIRQGLSVLPRAHISMQSLLMDEFPTNERHGMLQQNNLDIDLPKLELVALRAIDVREYHLSRLHALLLHRNPGPAPHAYDEDASKAYAIQLAAARDEVTRELQALRMSGVAVVEAVVRWRRRRHRQLEPFVWRSHNYLLKMLLDIFFLGTSATVADATADPFLLCCWQEPSTSPGLPSSSVSSDALGDARGFLSLPSTPASGTLRKHQSRRQQLALVFSPDRKHTKHELVRMWAAMRVLEAERIHIGRAFDPISPVLQPGDIELRVTASLLFFGDGEPAELARYDAKQLAAQRQPPPRGPDPAYKPPPPQTRPRRK